MIDVRRGLLSLSARARSQDAAAVHGVPMSQAQALARLDWNGPDVAGRELLELELRIAAEGGPKPVEVIRALWGDEVAGETRFARVALSALAEGQPCDPLQVERLRRPAPPARPRSVTSPNPCRCWWRPTAPLQRRSTRATPGCDRDRRADQAVRRQGRRR